MSNEIVWLGPTENHPAHWEGEVLKAELRDGRSFLIRLSNLEAFAYEVKPLSGVEAPVLVESASGTSELLMKLMTLPPSPSLPRKDCKATCSQHDAAVSRSQDLQATLEEIRVAIRCPDGVSTVQHASRLRWRLDEVLEGALAEMVRRAAREVPDPRLRDALLADLEALVGDDDE